ncbi:MAG TPA: crosslink repair DNA glycosylase YcaQ family protein, partial [Acidimicrobiia bacterium]
AAGVASPPRVIDGRAFNHALIVDGQLAGRWRRRLSRAHVELEVRPSRQLSEAEREVLEDTGRAYGRFHGLPVHWKGSVGDLRPR